MTSNSVTTVERPFAPAMLAAIAALAALTLGTLTLGTLTLGTLTLGSSNAPA